MTSSLGARARLILDFWFGPSGDPGRGQPRAIWFKKDADFDADVRRRCLADHEAAAAGMLDALMASAEGCLALCILLDQVPRNIFRGSPRAFATDAKARLVARAAVDAGFDRSLLPVERWFVYLPFEHSEDIADQRLSVALFESARGGSDSRDSMAAVYRHYEIIERFGRFPHRNAVLGRVSTPEELEFLKQPNSSF